MTPWASRATIPLTGAQYEIAAGDYRAVITELGAGLRGCSVPAASRSSLGYEADELPPAGAGQLLAPWPNRIDGGRYTFGGASYQLDLSEPARGNAIHGLTRWAGWQRRRARPGPRRSWAIAARPARLSVLPGARRRATGSRRTAGLEVTITARNAGQPARRPYGTGWHPYLTTGAPLIDDCELELPAAHWLPADDRGIPAGPAARRRPARRSTSAQPRRIGGTQLDHAFTGLARDSDGRAWARLAGAAASSRSGPAPATTGCRSSPATRSDLTRRRRALAIEPMTCPPNAFVTGTDLLTLEPGDSVAHRWGMQVLQS